MPYNLLDSSSEYFENVSVPASMPLTLACWFRLTDKSGSAIKGLMGITDNDTAGVSPDHLGLGIDTSERFQARSSQGGTANSSQSGVNTVTTGTWHHGAGVFASTTSRIAYLNGSAATENTTSSSPSGLDRLWLGRLSGSSRYHDGDLAHCAIWDAALTANEITSLSKGFSPLLVRRASLVFYAPLFGNASTELDIVGGLALSAFNTPSKIDAAPRVFMPRSKKFINFGAGTVITEFSGSGTPSLPAVTVSGSGTLTFSGTGAIGLNPITTVGVGALQFSATGSMQLGAVSVSGDGALSFDATAAISLAPIVVSGTGLYTPLAISGTAEISLPGLAVAGSGQMAEFVGSASISLNAVTVAANGDLSFSATATISLPPIEVAGVGTLTFAGTSSVALTGIQVAGSGSLIFSAEAAPTLSSIQVAGIGAYTPLALVGAGSITLAPITVVAVGDNGAQILPGYADLSGSKAGITLTIGKGAASLTQSKGSAAISEEGGT